MAVIKVPLRHFMNGPFKAFSMADNVRSIPSMCDGFKNSMRKAMYGMVLRGENAGELQIERLASQIAACLTEDTEVLLSDGSTKTIKEILEIDLINSKIFVKSLNEETGKFEDCELLKVFVQPPSKTLIEIETETGEILKMTPNHLVLTDRGWIEAKDLTHDDNLKSF